MKLKMKISSEKISIFRIVQRPMFVALAITIIWIIKRIIFNSILDIKEDQETLTQSVIPTFAIFHAIFASVVTVEVMNEFNETQLITYKYKIAKTEEEKENLFNQFLYMISVRVHILTKVFLKALTFLVIASFFLIKFHSTVIGIFSVYGISFTLMTFYQIIRDLDNPVRGLFNVSIPADWIPKLKQLGHIPK